MNLHEVAEICKDIAIEAGSAILDVYQTDFDVEYKQNASPLTGWRRIPADGRN